MKMRVAICFYELTRSLKYTHSSIEKYIFNILKDNNILYDIFLHTYNIYTPFINSRANEKDILLDNNSYKILNTTKSIIEDEVEVDSRLQLQGYRRHGDPWAPWSVNFQTLNNHIRALWSLKQVTKLWEESQESYTHVIYCRPDCKYLTPLNLKWFNLECNQVNIPDFGIWSKVNDRFVIAGPNEARVYGTRFNEALDYSKHYTLHSETFLNYILPKNKITWNYIHFRFNRVRANGSIPELDRKDNNQYRGVLNLSTP